jgi:DNA-binding Xre family transcriptional regulator
MADTELLVATLKKLLHTQGYTYAAVAQRVGLSEASVKRLFSRRTFTLSRLEQFCALLDMDLFELARVARGRAAEMHEMSIRQEEALVQDQRLLGLFYLVFNGWKFDDILAAYEIGKAECIRLLVQLDRIGVIDLLPGNHLRLKIPQTTRIRADGPIRRVHGRRVVGDFLGPSFDAAGGYFTLELRELSRASFEVLKRKLERVAAEFHELAELDSPLRSSARETIGMALGIRPWTMPLLSGLTPRKVRRR